MRIIKSGWEIIGGWDWKNILFNLTIYGRTCYKSNAAMDDEDNKKFIKGILERGHESVIEHEKITVKFTCDRGVSHEIVRHRIASYSQESTRYCNYSKTRFGGHLTFIKPCFFPEIPIGEFDDEASIINVCMMKKDPLPREKEIRFWVRAIQFSELQYNNMIREGGNPEEARSVLPNSLKTEIVCTFNLREWRHFFKLRTSKKAHPQMRELTIPLLETMKVKLPIIFDDIHCD